MKILNAYEKTAPHSDNLATMPDFNYDNYLPCNAVMYQFFQLSMGWGLEKKLKIISTIVLYAQPLKHFQVFAFRFNLLYSIFDLNQFQMLPVRFCRVTVRITKPNTLWLTMIIHIFILGLRYF